MKIAQVVCVFPPYGGGLGTVARELARGLAAANQEVTVFTVENKGETNYQEGYKVEILKPILKIGLGAVVPGLGRKLADFNVIHWHWPFFGAEWPCLLAKIRNRSIKLVITYHQDLVLNGWRKYFYWFYIRLILPLALHFADIIFYSSKSYFEHSELKKWEKRYGSKFKELPFGVGSEFTQLEKAESVWKKQFEPEDKVVLFVGGLDSAHYFKGVNILIDAIASLTDNKIKCLIVGAGNLLNDYKKTVTDRNLSDRIKFTGYVEQSELPALYNLADMLVLPSILKNEAFGLVLLEAMANGKPVIASDLPGVNSVVQDGFNGYVVKPGDSHDLAEKIRAIANNSELAQSFGENGLRLIEEKYNWSKIISDLLQIYQTK